MSGRHVAILPFLLAAAEAKLVVLNEADLLLSRFEFRPKLVAMICKREFKEYLIVLSQLYEKRQKNSKNCKTKKNRKHATW